jgi:hypothetical protein
MLRPLRLGAPALLLALIVALTSVTMAVARGQGRPAGEMVLCLGLGLVSVPIDDRGRPTGPAHLCPDAAPALFVADGIPAAQPSARPAQARAGVPCARALPGGLAAPSPNARGPPLFV